MQAALDFMPNRTTLAQQMREIVSQWNSTPDDAVEAVSIQGPQDAAQILQAMTFGLEQEHLFVLTLNTKNRVMHIHTAFKGTVNCIGNVRPADVFREAIRENAVSVIIAHNHPSGDPTPSPADVTATKMLVQAGKLLDVEVLDHLVIGGRGYVSIRSYFPESFR